MKPYVDTNFITRMYLRLPGTEQALDLIDQLQEQGQPPLPITWLHRLETINAFQLMVFTGTMSPHQPRVTSEQAAVAHANFRGDLVASTCFREIDLEWHKMEQQFEELVLRHTARQGFRTYDVLHVASALVLGCDTFWSFDPKASRLARSEGLDVIA